MLNKRFKMTQGRRKQSVTIIAASLPDAINEATRLLNDYPRKITYSRNESNPGATLEFDRQEKAVLIPMKPAKVKGTKKDQKPDHYRYGADYESKTDTGWTNRYR